MVYLTMLPYFNPRSRKGSDEYYSGDSDVTVISIHAPARGATSKRNLFRYSRHISIHAPARGATQIQRYAARLITISIHAPARGATYGEGIFFKGKYISIHAPARGATLVVHHNISNLTFQSTLPQGERPNGGSTWAFNTDFNPRSRKGSDRFLENISVRS